MATARPYRLALVQRGAPRAAARALESLASDQPDSFERYDGSSLFLAVTDAIGAVVGAARVILPGPAGLKTVEEVAAPPAPRRRAEDGDLTRTWDIASFTVRPGSSALVAAALTHGLVQLLRVNRVCTVVATLDEASRRMLSQVGLLPTPISRTAVRAEVSELLDVQRRVNAEGYRLVTCGAGLEKVLLPAPAQLRVTAPRLVALAGAVVRNLASSA
jgi:hypothetical protein